MHESDVCCVEFLFDGAVLITGSKDTTIKAWDAVGEQFALIETMSGAATSVMIARLRHANDALRAESASAQSDGAVLCTLRGSSPARVGRS